MAVRVRYFAALRERKAAEEELVELVPGETLGALYERLFPPDGRGKLPVAYARNQEHARPDDLASDGDEIVFLPPIGGG